MLHFEALRFQQLEAVPAQTIDDLSNRAKTSLPVYTRHPLESTKGPKVQDQYLFLSSPDADAT